MKLQLFICLIINVIVLSCTQNENTVKAIQQNDSDSVSATEQTVVATETYDSILAKRLGADEYGMKQYVLALLKSGPNRNQDKEASQKLMMAHLQNIERLANKGKLVVAGPFMESGDLRGLYIFNVTTKEEAEALVNTDPAIQAGSLVMELYPWYSSAALVDVNNIHKKLTKKSITE